MSTLLSPPPTPFLLSPPFFPPLDNSPQVLGLPANPTSDQVQRAYNSAKRQAVMDNDDARVSAVEAAHSSIMMSQLTSRMKARRLIPPSLP